MPLGNNIGSSTMRSWTGAGKLYQSNQNPKKAKSDPIGKLVIHNYNKDFKKMVFWGWDVIDAAELDENYIFQLAHRTETKLRVYITLGRVLQQPDIKYPETFYQCYIHDDNGDWDKTIWLDAKSINYKTFWEMIEKVVDGYHPILPF
jgi:hypothetical protein